ncbi:MOSC domain-containing protein [Nocardioides glacieisoli]|uniref:MOSC domain-containing protein n=1 Tax=Nocardioides glacieisoli TaxID=1168730 RepID=A0A4Q2RTE4_9ACTN|nr:MOSC domain-containing protein [Nocardioides glacieisoli]RYB92267.1 MOSC domain-containing protein [Nocardioides glacieisoli]
MTFETVGSVAALQIAATKGFALRSVPTVQVTPTGIEGNREFFLVDVDERLYSVPKDPIFLGLWTAYDPGTRVLCIGRAEKVECVAEVRDEGSVRQFEFDERVVDGYWTPGPWDEFVSRLAGRRLRLARCATTGGGFDVYPVTLLSTASLHALGSEPDGRPVDPRRFRLNMTLDLGGRPFAEDGWSARVLAVGACELRLRGGIPRCLAVENRPDDGNRDFRVQRRIREVRGATPSEAGPSVLLGVYAEVVTPGTVSVGDCVQLAR